MSYGFNSCCQFCFALLIITQFSPLWILYYSYSAYICGRKRQLSSEESNYFNENLFLTCLRERELILVGNLLVHTASIIRQGYLNCNLRLCSFEYNLMLDTGLKMQFKQYDCSFVFAASVAKFPISSLIMSQNCFCN